MSQQLLTEEQAAELLQLSSRTLRKARQGGKLPYVRFGRSVRYIMDDIEGFIKQARLANEPRQSRCRAISGGVASRDIVAFTQRRR